MKIGEWILCVFRAKVLVEQCLVKFRILDCHYLYQRLEVVVVYWGWMEKNFGTFACLYGEKPRGLSRAWALSFILSYFLFICRYQLFICPPSPIRLSYCRGIWLYIYSLSQSLETSFHPGFLFVLSMFVHHIVDDQLLNALALAMLTKSKYPHPKLRQYGRRNRSRQSTSSSSIQHSSSVGNPCFPWLSGWTTLPVIAQVAAPISSSISAKIS